MNKCSNKKSFNRNKVIVQRAGTRLFIVVRSQCKSEKDYIRMLQTIISAH